MSGSPNRMIIGRFLVGAHLGTALAAAAIAWRSGNKAGYRRLFEPADDLPD